MSHTPGPWEVRPYGHLKSGSIYEGNHIVASVYARHNSEKIRDDRARLIAAAPELRRILLNIFQGYTTSPAEQFRVEMSDLMHDAAIVLNATGGAE